VPNRARRPIPVLRLGFWGCLLISIGGTGAVQSAVLQYRCTNPASGTNWTIGLEPEGQRVDANPAQVSAAAASWRDPKSGGTYELDRTSGKLTFRNASSTGGYFLYYTCRPE
jgi:hypothetical protein